MLMARGLICSNPLSSSVPEPRPISDMLSNGDYVVEQEGVCDYLGISISN